MSMLDSGEIRQPEDGLTKGQSPRKQWETPHIISYTPADHTEGAGYASGDGFTNQS